MGHTKISTDIEQNIRQFQQLFADSADIKMKEMRLGKGKRRRCFLAYIEVAVSNMLLETTALGRLLAALSELPDRDLNQVLNENAMGISDVTPYDTIEDAAQGMLTGDAILFVDGYGHALKIADKGYPGMGVQEPDSEKVIRGSKEGFTDSIKTNTALIRKRVRSTRVKVEEVQEGVRSHTAIDLVYMADLKYTSVLEKIREKGVNEAFVTLHVGLGTFRPVKADNILEHHMHSELCMMNEETAALLNETRKKGGRIICVGTTSCRTLESLVQPDGSFRACSKWTDIFIYPGYKFKAMDGLITNFHLPESTLVMLVSAFAGREHVLNAYKIAVQEKYRFFSFGDAMFLR